MSNLAHLPDPLPEKVPYSRDYSPWFRDPSKPIEPPQGYFVLPENATRKPYDCIIGNGHWHEDYQPHGNTVKQDAAMWGKVNAYARPIQNDPGLHANMKGWAEGRWYVPDYWQWRDQHGRLHTSPATVVAASAAPQSPDVSLGRQEDRRDPPNFVVHVPTPALSKAVQQAAFDAGIKWEAGARIHENCIPTILVSRVPFRTEHFHHNAPYLYVLMQSTPLDDLPRYDAATQFGEILRLLTTPVKPEVKAPEIHGYKAKYTRNDQTVAYGCAEISLELFRDIALDHGLGNRQIASVTLDSGKTITRDQAKAVLIYINHVNSTP